MEIRKSESLMGNGSLPTFFIQPETAEEAILTEQYLSNLKDLITSRKEVLLDVFFITCHQKE